MLGDLIAKMVRAGYACSSDEYLLIFSIENFEILFNE